MSPRAAVYSACSVDPTHPFVQLHTDHRRTTRSEPPFYVPVTASSDARGRLSRAGANTPCHTSGTRHSFVVRFPDPEWLSQRAAADRGPASVNQPSCLTLPKPEKMTICPKRAVQVWGFDQDEIPTTCCGPFSGRKISVESLHT